MTRTLRNFSMLGLGILVALCGPATAQDYAKFRVLETRAVEDMWTSAGQKAALLSPDGSRVLHLNGREFCLLAPSQIGPWAKIACGQSTPENRPGDAADMFWSPAGDRLLMPTNSDALLRFRDTDIRLFDPMTFTVENLTDDGFDDSLFGDHRKGPANFDLAPRWLDGDTIAFIRYVIPAEGFSQAGPLSLMSIEVGGGEPKELFRFATGRGIPIYATAISPDGTQLAYSVDGSADTQNLGIYLLSLADPAPSLIAAQADIGRSPTGLAFSADGKYLLVLSQNVDGVDARVIDLATGKVVPVDPVQNVVGVAWSPTGSALAYLTYDRTRVDMPGGLFLASAPGDAARLLIGGAFFPTVCCGQQPVVWATNDTMIVAQLGEKLGTVLFVRLGQ